MLCSNCASKHVDWLYMRPQHSRQSFKPSQPSNYSNMSVKRRHTGEPVGEANYKFELEHNENSILIRGRIDIQQQPLHSPPKASQQIAYKVWGVHAPKVLVGFYKNFARPK